MPDAAMPRMNAPVMPDIRLTRARIWALVLGLNAKKLPGPGGVNNTFLKRYVERVSYYLHVIFVESLRTSRLPNDWLCAKIVPTQKAGKKHIISNYRPISLTRTSCITLETIISKAITTHLETNNVFCPHQHGFRAGLSTVAQLAETTLDLALAINARQQTDESFIDLSKVFDGELHQKMPSKPQAIGMGGTLVL